MAKADLAGTLSQIHAIGYQEVELSRWPTHFLWSSCASWLRSSGLKAPSGHFEYTDLSANGITPKLPV